MPAEVMVLVRLHEELNGQIDRLASVLRCKHSWIIAEAIRRYVDAQMGQIRAIREALDDYRRGKTKLTMQKGCRGGNATA